MGNSKSSAKVYAADNISYSKVNSQIADAEKAFNLKIEKLVSNKEWKTLEQLIVVCKKIYQFTSYIIYF
jgi:hypothetical protein